MLIVQVNTSLLKTKLKITLHETNTASNILYQVAEKLKDPVYMNSKMFSIIPIYPRGSQESKANKAFALAKYGGMASDYMEMMFNNQQSSGMFEYDSNYIDLNTIVKNLKTNTVEMTERVYVDKPMKKQKEVPIEKKQEVASTLKEANILAKINDSSTKGDPYATTTSFIIGGQPSDNRATFTPRELASRSMAISNP